MYKRQDQTWDVVGEGAVDDDDVRVEGVENRVQADSDVEMCIRDRLSGRSTGQLAETRLSIRAETPGIRKRSKIWRIRSTGV